MPFRAPIKVCFSDIDNAGIVYYPRFTHYFHLAMEEFFSSEMGMAEVALWRPDQHGGQSDPYRPNLHYLGVQRLPKE